MFLRTELKNNDTTEKHHMGESERGETGRQLRSKERVMGERRAGRVQSLHRLCTVQLLLGFDSQATE